MIAKLESYNNFSYVTLQAYLIFKAVMCPNDILIELACRGGLGGNERHGEERETAYFPELLMKAANAY